MEFWSDIEVSVTALSGQKISFGQTNAKNGQN